MVTIYAAHVPDFPEYLLESLMDYASEKKEKLNRYHRKEDRIRGLLGELLIHKIISEVLNIPHSNLKFMTNAYGKPFVNECELEFNLSHSGDWVVCAFDQNPVGIDIEKIDTINLELAHRFFTQEEYNYIMRGYDERQQRKRFYLVWSAKESVMKAVGKGLSIPLNSFNVMSGDSIAQRIMMDGVAWHITNVLLDPNYSLFLCSLESETQPIEIINMQSFVSTFL